MLTLNIRVSGVGHVQVVHHEAIGVMRWVVDSTLIAEAPLSDDDAYVHPDGRAAWSELSRRGIVETTKALIAAAAPVKT